MIELSTIKKHDLDNMHNVYDRWPQIAKEAFESEIEPVDFKDIDHVVFSGMGGSGTIGDLFASILSKTDIHTTVVKGYELPKTVDDNTLVVTTSVSGNTVETLATLESASKKNCKVIGFSSDGTMESFCTQNNIEHRRISKIHSPRASFPIYVYSILKTLNSIIPIDKQEIVQSLDKLENLSQKISSTNLSETNPSLDLAEWLNGTPVIYYPWGLHATAIRFKNSLQENAKTHVIIEDIIETGHNGIVSWERPSDMVPIMIEGTDDHPKTKERWEILRQYFDENQIEYKEILSVDGGILSKILCLIYLLDYATIFHAIRLKIDPSPVKSIDFFKKKL
ncbi:glucose-mannose-6-phosphate isomerase protein [Marine Group I thaumarchaeote SCGC AAA799-P11]|uniref:Glucose-mannose-6-phosphate isomerase protein n=1 Tax=Marine Group I thaumarchaeote SCGC AAA799-P11 TaxID=1502295 RepID=A0A087S324_9ARCH|nr:glucose-mannose-6-phosphate isomerase protein [Marine Group I thaumarchaeote SCGC AAA799-P11]